MVSVPKTVKYSRLGSKLHYLPYQDNPFYQALV